MKYFLSFILLVISIASFYGQDISADIVPSFPISNDGILRICPNNAVTFEANVDYGVTGGDNSTTEFSWSLSDSPQAGVLNDTSETYFFSYPAGITLYLSILETVSGTSFTTSLPLQVSASPNTELLFDENPGSILLGELLEVSASSNPQDQGYLEPFEGDYLSSGMFLNVLFLPDGSGFSWESTIEITDAGPGTTVSAGNQITEIWANLEHSYLGDLDIEITCPNGSSVTLQEQGGGSCNLGIPWATAPVDGQSNITTQGTGFIYSWNMEAELSLEEGCVGMVEFANGDGPDVYSDSQVLEGYYLPDESMDSLIGCPVNGTWTMTITDNIGADNGWNFGWGLNFSQDVLPPDSVYTITITDLTWELGGEEISSNGILQDILSETGVIEYDLVIRDESGCDYRVPYPVDVYDPLSINELSDNDFKVSVSGDVLEIVVNDSGQSMVEIFNLQGSMVLSTVFSGTLSTPVSPGKAYLIRVVNSNGSIGFKKLLVF
jgi:subtilisin-like proprotein convertase family protein